MYQCPWKEAFTFKGGTSLSKCYGLIKRFSEDIDLIHEANRPENLSMPGRYSRHYYDLYCIAHSDIKESVYSNIAL